MDPSIGWKNRLIRLYHVINLYDYNDPPIHSDRDRYNRHAHTHIQIIK